MHSCLICTSLSRGVTFLAVATLLSSAARARPQAWGLQPSTSANDAIWSLVLDGTGGTIEVGHSQGPLGGPGQGLFDMYAARRDAAGTLIWSRQWGTPTHEYPSSAAADGAGGFFVAGQTQGSLHGPNLGQYDAVVEKRDSAGDVLWGVQIGTSQDEFANFVVPDGAGGCFAGGKTSGSLAASNLGSSDLWCARYDAAGSALWTIQFGSASTDDAQCAAPDGSGGILVGGISAGDLGGPVGNFDSIYLRIDPAGNLLWLRQFGSSGEDNLRAILPDGAGGAYLAGSSYASPGPGLSPGATISRVDAAGTFLWTKSLGNSGDSFRSIVPDGAGGVFAGGDFFMKVAPSAWNLQAFLTRFAPDGIQGPMNVIGSTQSDHFQALVRDGATGCTAAGFTQGDLFGSSAGSFDAWIARFESCDLDAFTGYCTAGVNSTGKGASIGSWGSPYVSSNDFTLTVQDCPPSQVGLFLMGDQPNNLPFGNGVLCVGGGLKRLHPAQPTGAVGTATLPLDFTDPSSYASWIAAGSTWNFQFWYRDIPAGGAEFNLSNGLSATFCP